MKKNDCQHSITIFVMRFIWEALARCFWRRDLSHSAQPRVHTTQIPRWKITLSVKPLKIAIILHCNGNSVCVCVCGPCSSLHLKTNSAQFYSRWKLKLKTWNFNSGRKNLISASDDLINEHCGYQSLCETDKKATKSTVWSWCMWS